MIQVACAMFLEWECADFFFLQMFSCCYNGIVHPKKCKCCHHLL